MTESENVYAQNVSQFYFFPTLPKNAHRKKHHVNNYGV